jgi:hypothetical protein
VECGGVANAAARRGQRMQWWPGLMSPYRRCQPTAKTMISDGNRYLAHAEPGIAGNRCELRDVIPPRSPRTRAVRQCHSALVDQDALCVGVRRARHHSAL